MYEVFELVTVQLSAQCSLQSISTYRQNFHYIKILSTFHAFSCLKAESCFFKEVRTELGSHFLTSVPLLIREGNYILKNVAGALKVPR